jgi:alcohol dehydrogenase class IV
MGASVKPPPPSGPVVWNFPTRIVFGAGALARLPDEAKQLGGRRALVVGDPGVVKAGLVERAIEALAAGLITADVFHDIGTNPTGDEALAAAEACKAAAADVIVAIGGGAAIDVAKIVRILATHPAPLARYDAEQGGADVTAPLPPMIAIPTTAGTGSEVGRSAVATLAETGRKTIFFSPRLIPSVALLDPELTLSLPPGTTAATGFDALTHNIEALCTPMDHPMAEAIARQGIRLVAAHLDRAVQDGANLAARAGMQKAALCGGVAFQRGLGACHSLAHPLSTEFGLHHGLANALCLPAIADFNRHVSQRELAFVAEAFGAKAGDEKSMAFECAGALRALRRKVGLPDGLGAAGVPEDRFESLADLAFADPCHRENPRVCTREDLLALYRASM